MFQVITQTLFLCQGSGKKSNNLPWTDPHTTNLGLIELFIKCGCAIAGCRYQYRWEKRKNGQSIYTLLAPLFLPPATGGPAPQMFLCPREKVPFKVLLLLFSVQQDVRASVSRFLLGLFWWFYSTNPCHCNSTRLLALTRKSARRREIKSDAGIKGSATFYPNR